MYDFRSIHVGKDLYRAKTHEEDIIIINEVSNIEFPVSLKAYGDGPLQLSTNKNSNMFQCLEREQKDVRGKENIQKIVQNPAFAEFSNINALPLIYNEKKLGCNILVFDYDRAIEQTSRIVREDTGKGRKHPVYRFYDSEGNYICEVRYGDAAANALQRGLWTNTKHGLKYFDSLTNGWIDYSHNHILVKLFSHALVSSSAGHTSALEKIKEDIAFLKKKAGISK
jgi:hypothetical protein